MRAVERKYRKEIEVEQMWAVTEHGGYVFASMLLVSTLLVYGLWTTARHDLLLDWLAMLTAVNLLKWLALQHYHRHKAILFDNLSEFKRVAFMISALTGLCWGLCVVWFLEPARPGNALLIGLTVSIEIVGALLTWTCYVPAILAISLPPAVPLIAGIFLQGSHIFTTVSIVLSILTCLGVTSSQRLAGTLRQALLLNFENVLLRQASEEQSLLLETTLENMRQGICMSDKDDRLRMWNRPFVEMLGPAGSQAETGVKLSALLAAAQPPIVMDARTRMEYRSPGGQVLEVQLAEMPEGGRVLTFTDITELNQREQALNTARKEAERANAAKTRFLAAASHDLRQPIHALGLFFGELTGRVYSAETAKLIGQIDDAIASINSMLNALLDISKLDAGIVRPCIETVDLGDLFMRLQAEFRATALENRNALRVRATRLQVKSDPAMLESMLRNLLGNASRYTESGRIVLAARRRGETCVIRIVDTGCGIPEDQLDEIFLEFHQLHNAARDRHKGLGLGLSIVKRLAKLLHHDIQVKSQPGKGSCFSLAIPIAEPRQNAVSKDSLIDPFMFGNRLAGRRILILDDDAAVRESMQGLLTQWGCRVITACSQAEAMAQLAANEHKIEVLMIDYRLVDAVSGLEVANRLQAESGYAFQVLVITGDTDPERLREANASGYPLLHKPVVPAKLRSRLLDLLSA